MSYVDPQSQSERLTLSVTQAVYDTVFENARLARDIAAEQAEKRRAEEAARQETEVQANKPTPAEAQSSPSVIVDIQSTAVDTTTASQPAAAASAHTVNLIA